MNEITVVGLGHIGLPIAVMLASAGFNVRGVDSNPNLVNALSQGLNVQLPDRELLPFLKEALASGRLSISQAAGESDAFIIAVPTPLTEANEADLRFIYAACTTIAPVLRPGNLVILESTSPVGTTEALCNWLGAARPELAFPGFVNSPRNETELVHIAYCPERTRPGNLVSELQRNDRVIGGITPTCAEAAKSLYEKFVLGEICLTDARTAELVKLTENSYRDVAIAFANEISMISDELGIDATTVLALANRHPRVDILTPGPGVGGHCIAVDPWFLAQQAPTSSTLIKAARLVNTAKTEFTERKLLGALQEFHDVAIAYLGLSYKANTYDTRESPAVRILESVACTRKDLQFLVADPHVQQTPESLRVLPNVSFVSVEVALEKAQCIAILVPHSVFRSIFSTAKVPILNYCGLSKMGVVIGEQ